MFITNYKNLATNEIRKMLLEIIEAGFHEIDPKTWVKTHVLYNTTFNSVVVRNKPYDLIKGRIFVVGGGKAAGYMAEAIEEIVGPDNITAGVVNVKGGKYKTKKIETVEAGHPLPDKRGVKGVQKIFDLKEKYNIGKKDLVICLLSGGGSSLLPSLEKDIKLEDKILLTNLMIKAGMTISEMNAVRKHLSVIKGGKLAEHFAPAKVISLIISDVIGAQLEVIASGPTVADPTTYQDAISALDKYKIKDKIPKKILEYLEKGSRGELPETPKVLNNVDNYVLAGNETALEAMATCARNLGLRPLVVSSSVQGNSGEVASGMARLLASGEYEGYDLLLFGGETTMALPPDAGEGGRNMHFVASTMVALKEWNKKWAMASFSTDGEDYTDSSAGAIIDSDSYKNAMLDGIDPAKYLEKYDTYNFFKKTKDLIITGKTGTNVADIMVYLIEK